MQHLAQNLKQSLGLYGFAAPGLNSEAPFFFRLETMAAAYLRDIREQQPHGPYRLGGYSMGGVVAFEMAHQLQSAGEQIDLLVMIDSFAPHRGLGADIATWSRNGLLMQVVSNQLALQWKADALMPAESLVHLPFNDHSEFAARYLLAHCKTPHGLETLQSYLRRCQTVMRVHAQLLADYRPTPLSLPVKVLLFRNTLGIIARESALKLPTLPDAQRDPPHSWEQLLCQPPISIDVEEEHFMFGGERVMGIIARSLSAHL